MSLVNLNYFQSYFILGKLKEKVQIAGNFKGIYEKNNFFYDEERGRRRIKIKRGNRIFFS